MTPTETTNAPAGTAGASPTAAFWTAVVDDIRGGRFWNAEAKNQDGQPVERLEAAMEGLPKAGAFKEAAIATRGIIRNRMKEDRDWERHLGLLYWLAVVDAQPTDDDERAALTGDRLYATPIDYHRTGHASLGLLNKTDRVWLAERWGEPAAPTTLDAARGGASGATAPAPAPAASGHTRAEAEKAQVKASSAADHAGEAAREAADALGETASVVRDKANAASAETSRAAQQTRVDLERAGRWLGGRLGSHHPAGSDERRFTDRQDVALVAIGGLVVLLLILALIF